jgi:hypothetical protein
MNYALHGIANEFHSEYAIKPAVHYDFDMSADRLYMFIDLMYNGVSMFKRIISLINQKHGLLLLLLLLLLRLTLLIWLLLLFHCRTSTQRCEIEFRTKYGLNPPEPLTTGIRYYNSIHHSNSYDDAME